MIEPVYPKEDPEYRKRVLQNFYNKVKNTDWGKDDIRTSTPSRGRKPAPAKERIESRPRTAGEKSASQQGYNWFDKWTKK